MNRQDENSRSLARRAVTGDSSALGTLLERDRGRLLRMVAARLDSRLTARLDASDIVQEACLEATQRLQDYLDTQDMPFVVWLRFLTGQKLVALHRKHLGAQARDAGREDDGGRPQVPDVSSVSLIGNLLGDHTSPTAATRRNEARNRLESALSSMDHLDREVLSLRHYEQLSNSEAAAQLGLSVAAASKRYLRALRRLRETLGAEESAILDSHAGS